MMMDIQDDAHIQEEWARLYHEIPRALRDQLSRLIDANREALTDAFYTQMLQDPQATRFLDHEIVSTRLRASMQRWITGLFCSEDEHSVQAAIAQQRHVGEVHARIHLPPQLMTRGARRLRRQIGLLIEQGDLERQALPQAMRFVAELMDLAMELMNSAYTRSSTRSTRAEEAYRHHALGHSISVERERQRAALLEWSQQLLFSLQLHGHDVALSPLARSELGMWINHKARVMFEGAAELEDIAVIIERIDNALLPQFVHQTSGDTEHLRALSRELQAEIKELLYLLSAMFDRFAEVENGRDALTRLLNRRFLPAVLGREVALHQKTGYQFGVLLIDIDHFKQINDSYSHEGGDQVLQQAAQLISNNVRAGDFVFRYGGEEILVVIVEVSPEDLQLIAEKIRRHFEATRFPVRGGRQVQVTISIGVANYDGHPDYQYLITRADDALYRAKRAGRNRVELAS